jgi:hypothetical protein
MGPVSPHPRKLKKLTKFFGLENVENRERNLLASVPTPYLMWFKSYYMINNCYYY